MQEYSQVSELIHFSRYMKKQIMMNQDINDFLEELILNKAKFNISNYSSELSLKKVLLIEDSNKNDRWIKQLNNLEVVYLDSDHNFTNQRLSLIHISEPTRPY